MKMCAAFLLVTVIVLCAGSQVRPSALDHHYKAGDSVPLYGYKVGPFRNPSETYGFYDLPFCTPVMVPEIEKEPLTEVLKGEKLLSAPHKLNFLVDKEREVLCRKKLSKEEVLKFVIAIKNDYYMQLYCDELPLWAFIGNVDRLEMGSQQKYILYTHFYFEIFYNEDRVIEVDIRTDPRSFVELAGDKEVVAEFFYTVKWRETSFPFEKRMEKYTMSSLLPHHLDIHHFSIKRSCVATLLLAGFLVAYYLRVLKKDFTEYSQDEESADNEHGAGWKSLHGDVFRYPKYKSLLAATLGSGTQLLTLTISILILAIFGLFYPYQRGALFTALVAVYAVTSGIAGYTATSFYCQLGGTNWVGNLLLTGSIYSGPLFLAFCFLNTIATSKGSTAALPLRMIVAIVLTWLLVAVPLLVVGGFIGKYHSIDFQAPCRTSKCPRDIPSLPCYRSTLPQMMMSAILPFGVAYVELYYVLASLWGHRVYYIYGILFVVFVILLLVTAFITVAFTYFQLAAEDHRWWWRSFLCGGSAGVLTYGYCFYYYFVRSDMSGIIQTSYFFGYMACVSYGICLMLGSVGFRASLLVVRHIYGSIKCE